MIRSWQNTCTWKKHETTEIVKLLSIGVQISGLWFGKYDSFFNFHNIYIFSHLVKKSLYQIIIQFCIPKQKQNFYSAIFKNNFNMHVSCFMSIVLLLLHVDYLKKLREFSETDLFVSAMKYRLNFLFFVDVNLHSYITMHG